MERKGRERRREKQEIQIKENHLEIEVELGVVCPCAKQCHRFLAAAGS